MSATVYVARITDRFIGSVQQAVARAMRGINWAELIPDPVGSIFVKLNCMSGEPMPGTCTSPWVVEGFLAEVRRQFPRLRVFVGDADGYSVQQVESYMRNWGVDQTCAEYDAVPANLSKMPCTDVDIGPILGRLGIPSLLLEVDAIVTLPVLKTHCLTRMTGALKNQWGLLPKVRYRFHPVVSQAIAEINSFFSKIAFTVVDATVAQEGPGPRCGVPRILDTILVSRDRVAADAAGAWMIGLEAGDVPHVVCSEAAGVGSTRHRVEGDEMERVPLRPAVASEHFLYRWRDRLQSNRLANSLLFENPPVYFVLGKLARFYNKSLWYDRHALRLAEPVLTDSLSGAEFAKLLGCKGAGS